MDKSLKPRPIDPILNLPVQFPVTSLSFVSSSENSSISSALHDLPEKLGHQTERRARDPNILSKNDYSEDCDHENDINDDSDDEDDDEIEFRSSTLRVGIPESGYAHKQSSRLLRDRIMASCHSNGEALIWDLQNQKQAGIISPPRDGSGVCIRRTDDPSQVMFQTRDPKGTVTVHSIERCCAGGHYHGSGVYSEPASSTITNRYETHSKTFCRATPCHGNKHLLALPNIDHSTVTVVDVRTDASVAKYSIDNHGMVTSLALSITGNGAGNGAERPILACGMESGTTVFFDIADGSTKTLDESSFSIGKDPILALDTLSSSVPQRLDTSSFPAERYTDAILVAAGMAGDAPDVAELGKDEAGRAVVFKTLYSRSDCNNPSWNFRQRARISTCRVDRETYNGKPGISVCRYRPEDGRLLAIGGWDKRIRLFERSKGNLLAILKGSNGSIVDLDWAPDAMTSGLIASADKDEKLITLWQCFANQ